MNEPPIPQPHRFTCPRCGFGFDQNASFCPNCGNPLTPNSSASSLKIVGQIFLALTALCSGGFGGCIILIFGLDGARGDAGAILVGVIPLLIAVACIWGIFRLARRKP